jgi:hypothetical protein
LRYLLFSDIHSNLEALEVCLELAQGKYEQVLCLGDLVGYGPDPNAVIEKIRPLASIIIRGNHDKACSGHTVAAEFNPLARLATEWTRNELTPEHFGFLHCLPFKLFTALHSMKMITSLGRAKHSPCSGARKLGPFASATRTVRADS